LSGFADVRSVFYENCHRTDERHVFHSGPLPFMRGKKGDHRIGQERNNNMTYSFYKLFEMNKRTSTVSGPLNCDFLFIPEKDVEEA
jgi:hypothetical protein